MPRNKSQSEISILQDYRIALENTVSNELISETMAEFGYDDTLLSEGRNLLDETFHVYKVNTIEDQETREVSKIVNDLWDQIEDMYSLDRKKARVVFMDDPEIMKNLQIVGPEPRVVDKWLEMVSSFYTTFLENEKLKMRVAILKITPERCKKALSIIDDLFEGRRKYRNEIGESQNATQVKNQAFEKLDNWMKRFYATARIALEDQPQLLESLSKTVKSE